MIRNEEEMGFNGINIKEHMGNKDSRFSVLIQDSEVSIMETENGMKLNLFNSENILYVNDFLEPIKEKIQDYFSKPLVFDFIEEMLVFELRNEKKLANAESELKVVKENCPELEDKINLAITTTNPSVLNILSESEDNWIRSRVANNVHTSQITLSKLAEDNEPTVRAYVADNRNTEESVLSKLANDSESYVREAVAVNYNTPIEVLSKLATDYNDEVKEVAEERIKKRSITEDKEKAKKLLDKLQGLFYKKVNEKYIESFGDYNTFSNDMKIAINFKTNEVYLMRNNEYEQDNNVHYFSVPSESQADLCEYDDLEYKVEEKIREISIEREIEEEGFEPEALSLFEDTSKNTSSNKQKR